jgi:hypothetical protein
MKSSKRRNEMRKETYLKLHYGDANYTPVNPIPEYTKLTAWIPKLKMVLAAAIGLTLVSCTDADVASRNLSKAADQFEVNRRVVFYNGITGSYMLSIEGLCSLGNSDAARQLTVTCKTGPSQFKKHFLGLSDNVTYFVEQLQPQAVSVYHYRVIFKPQTILPDIDFKGDVDELISSGS